MFTEICSDYNSQLLNFEGEEDHVHLLLKIASTTRISNLIRTLKSKTAKIVLRSEYPSVKRNLWGGILWSASYFVASAGGAPLDVIKNYIRNQNSPRT